nr:hypothetical protein Iba_chr08cCG4020 [Ipomoea batatas]
MTYRFVHITRGMSLELQCFMLRWEMLLWYIRETITWYLTDILGLPKLTGYSWTLLSLSQLMQQLFVIQNMLVKESFYKLFTNVLLLEGRCSFLHLHWAELRKYVCYWMITGSV